MNRENRALIRGRGDIVHRGGGGNLALIDLGGTEGKREGV